MDNISAFPRGAERRKCCVIVYYTVMGKLKKSSRNTFNYNVNKKKLKIKLKKKDNPHIEW